MKNKQVSFSELINPEEKSKNDGKKSNLEKSNKKNREIQTKNTSKKKSTINTLKTSSTKKSQRVSFTSDEMDKLCEVFDWYLSVRDKIEKLYKVSISENNDFINPQKLIKSKKVSISIEEKIWDEFTVLCNNTGSKKSELLTQIIKEYLIDKSDLI